MNSQSIKFCVLCIAVLSQVTLASDYGTLGLFDTPTARMRSDGEFAVTVAHDDYAEAYSLTYQIFPNLEGTYRYTGIPNWTGRATNTAGGNYWDRNYEVKARLIKESEYLPEVSVGIRDLVGTGLYSAEYLVASKFLGPLNISLGLGWGRLAGESTFKNPLAALHPAFATRTKDVGKGGTLSVGEWFRGDQVGLFGGIQYRPDGSRFTFKAEYNPDVYRREVRLHLLQPPSNPFSFGIDWEIAPGYSLSLSRQHGNGIGLSFTAAFDSTKTPSVNRPSPLVSKPKSETEFSVPDWYLETTDGILQAGVVPTSIQVIEEDGKAEVELSRGAYQYWPDAINAAHAQAVATLPAQVSKVDYLVNEAGMNLQTVRLPRITTPTGSDQVRFPEQAQVLPARLVADDAYRLQNVYESTPTVSAFVDVNYHLFDPDNPFGYDVYAGLGSAVPIADGWFGVGIAQYSLLDNLDANTRVSSSVLPHVRSDAAQYKKTGDIHLSVLKAEKRGTLTPTLHYRLFGGILETMYSGAGAEILYQPHQSRLALGLSGAYAKQRDYEGLFGHFDYDVLTGHASLYWATPFYSYDAALHVGRYLAKDVGGTLEVRRTFNNGWSLGLWATLTDVPFATFGEGSFDKGIYLQIPFNLNITGGVGSGFNARIRPIQRDGGARLEDYSGQLWWDTRKARADIFVEPDR